ncbi:Plasmodium vivax Vir protein, putative [Plasmodium vivax]|uniref:Vir protein, putative n=1 Tax=Plasmodium vivax TaxID=5855 RepID=A0A1G4H9C7_PLAVI|nr:Plasmodium vivax Vir protein, putative [Plasmodium vivax]
MEATIKGERITFYFLSSNKFDKALKEDVQDNRYSTYYNGISALNKIFPWIGDLSKKLSRNISFVHDSYIPGDEFNKKRCYDLNFWLHDQVYKNLQSSKKSTEYLGGIVDKLQSVWQDIVDKEFKGRDFTCLPDKKLLLNMQFLQEIKDLFDFFQDYSEIKGEIIAKPLEACLNHKGKELSKRNDGIYMKMIEDFKKEAPGKNLLVTDLGEMLQYGTKYYIPGDHGDINFQLRFVRLRIFKEKAVPPILSMIAILLILCAFYKFTPFGNFLLRMRAKIRKKIRPNIDYEDILLLNESDEYLESYSDESRYNLSYSSLAS